MNEEMAGLTDEELEAEIVPLMRRKHLTARALELAEEAYLLARQHKAEVWEQQVKVLAELNTRYRAVAEAAELHFTDPPVLSLEDDGE